MLTIFILQLVNQFCSKSCKHVHRDKNVRGLYNVAVDGTNAYDNLKTLAGKLVKSHELPEDKSHISKENECAIHSTLCIELS